jgi:cytidylate kinase
MECVNPKRLRYDYNVELKEHVFFDNKDITPYLKDKFMDQATSIVSVNADVRSAVTAMQRAIALRCNVITDGRDVGSVVFPQAQLKFFLTATVEVRADRWRRDQERYNNHFSLDEAIALITDRDERDKKRTIAPLIIPHDAIVIDSSKLTIEETVQLMMKYINDCLPFEL